MNILISTLALLVLVAPTLIFAQGNPTPTSLINLPASPQPGENGFSNYINLLYALSISAAALLAVIKIIIAGVKYMLTDVVTSKGDAIRDIKGALLGLLLIIGAVLILTVINPKLLDATLEFDPQPMPDVNVAQRSSVQSTNQGGTTSGGTTTSGGSTTSGGNTMGGTTTGGSTSGGTTTQVPSKNCVATSNQTSGSYLITTYNLSSCNTTYRFADEGGQTAYILALNNSRSVCNATVSSQNPSWKGQFTCSGSTCQCRVYNP